DYGGRGIGVCQEWRRSFLLFATWAQSTGYRDDLQIDRVDNSQDYSPANCRWVTAQENQRNSRQNHLLTAFAETKPLVCWIEDSRCVVGYSTLRMRILRGWLPELALTTKRKWSRGKDATQNDTIARTKGVVP